MSSTALRQRYIPFEDNIVKTESCWVWRGKLTKDGYGRYYRNNEAKYAHRHSYETYKGSIPNGLVIDHLCRNRACVNPNHLEAVTNKTNIARGDMGLRGAHNKQKTHCKWGHEFDAANTYLDPRGKRGCKKCRNRS